MHTHTHTHAHTCTHLLVGLYGLFTRPYFLQERYCLLSKGIFSYYKSPKHQSPQGSISMSSLQYARLFSDDETCTKFELKASSDNIAASSSSSASSERGTRTFLFSAETHTESAAWVAALTAAKHTDAMVQEELENVRVRALSPPSIIAFDKLDKTTTNRSSQTLAEINDLFLPPTTTSPEHDIASCAESVTFLKKMCRDCRADAALGKPSRPDVLQHYFEMYVTKIEATILPLLEEKDVSADVDVEMSFERAEALSRKYLTQSSPASSNRGGSSKSTSKTSADPLSGLDSWLFGENTTPATTASASASPDPDSPFAEDEDPPVIFTLNMGDLRSLISFMYSYQDLFTQIQLEYASSRFDPTVSSLHRPNLLWPYLPVVVDAYVDGEDGARRGMQSFATTAVTEQVRERHVRIIYSPPPNTPPALADSEGGGRGRSSERRLALLHAHPG